MSSARSPETHARSTAEAAGTRGRPWPLALALFAVSLGVYAYRLAAWSLDGDEFYTFDDSRQPLSALLQTEIKPLYYVLCHGLLALFPDAPLEVTLRAPAAIAAALVPAAALLLTWRPGRERIALCVAVLLAANPWLFELAQFARFYSSVWLCAVVATLSLRHWVRARSPIALAGFAVAAALATGFHTPALVLVPAGVVAVFASGLANDRDATLAWVRGRARWLALAGAVALGGVALLFGGIFRFWLESPHGDFGNYSAVGIVLALGIYAGPSVWAFALLPALVPGGEGPAVSDEERVDAVFFASMAAACALPLLALSFFGGGVAPLYLSSALPGIFVLAGTAWARLDGSLGRRLGLRCAVAVALLAPNLPLLASVAVSGNHFDYRAAARFVDGRLAEDPQAEVIGSSREMLGHYLEAPLEVTELGRFEYGMPRERLEQAIARNRAAGRTLWVVSREDRHRLSSEDEAWFLERFALTWRSDPPRFDHRRFRMSVYRMREAGS